MVPPPSEQTHTCENITSRDVVVLPTRTVKNFNGFQPNLCICAFVTVNIEINAIPDVDANVTCDPTSLYLTLIEMVTLMVCVNIKKTVTLT